MDEPISHLMTKSVWTVEMEDTAEKVEDLLNLRSLSAVPVVDENGAVFGIISAADMRERGGAHDDQAQDSSRSNSRERQALRNRFGARFCRAVRLAGQELGRDGDDVEVVLDHYHSVAASRFSADGALFPRRVPRVHFRQRAERLFA